MIIHNGDHAEFEIEHANTPPKERPDWPLPSFDARDWAEWFVELTKRTDQEIDVAWMTSVFANALMRGHDEGWFRAQEKSSGETPVQLPPLDKAMRQILGRPNFMCRDIARMLEKRSGVPMERASEIEQAETIYFLLGMYLKHGAENWAWEADKWLRGETPAATTAGEKS